MFAALRLLPVTRCTRGDAELTATAARRTTHAPALVEEGGRWVKAADKVIRNRTSCPNFYLGYGAAWCRQMKALLHALVFRTRPS